MTGLILDRKEVADLLIFLVTEHKEGREKFRKWLTEMYAGQLSNLEPEQLEDTVGDTLQHIANTLNTMRGE